MTTKEIMDLLFLSYSNPTDRKITTKKLSQLVKFDFLEKKKMEKSDQIKDDGRWGHTFVYKAI